jgi:D-lactate dehydrogenase (cytochrome)
MQRATPAQLDGAVEALKSLLGQRASTAEVQREHHSHDESYHPPALPDVVCYAHSTEEVSEILKISAKYQVPVIPFGGGTSLEGHVNALHGGISIDLREMNKVLRVSAEDLDVTVQPGVTRQQLNKVLDNTGLTFYVDPGGESTLGGMAATRASGTTTVRYGTMRENVLALTVVLADGRIIKTGSRARKSAAGYDLTRLFVGSEGTLGVITELTLRVHPIPEAVSAAVCSFPSIESAVNTVIEVIQFGVTVARIELLDETQMDAINRYSKMNYPIAPTLFFEFHGSSDRHVTEQAEFVQSIAEEHGGKGFQWATLREDRERLWEARHAAYYADIALRPGAKGWTTDACVPISRLAECIMETQKDNRTAPFPVAMVGHVGDGNFHCVYVIDPEKKEELAEAERLAGRIATRALAMGGTCTGEHGVGYGKMKYLEAEHGAGLEVMRTIKLALDPDNRMNPGKMVKV